MTAVDGSGGYAESVLRYPSSPKKVRRTCREQRRLVILLICHVQYLSMPLQSQGKIVISKPLLPAIQGVRVYRSEGSIAWHENYFPLKCQCTA
jgi:hypothetical protein